jgi:ATP-binding cassette subfamily F protein 3
MMKLETEKLLESYSKQIDKDSINYLLSYFDDESNDFSNDGLLDFLGPLMEDAGVSEEIVTELCGQISNMNPNINHNSETEEGKVLKQAIQMHDSISATLELGQKVGDIRHTMSNRGPEKSLVDQRKLRNAEKKIEEKRKQRGLYNGEVIPEWNPTQVPQMVVNQAKKVNAADSRSKDIKLEDFDIQFAGKKILQNANLLLANGRRYGLVGKNGIGKSTLLRAIANRELQVPSHIKILHVEQEIAGDETTALMSVLKADKEREHLLEEERNLNIKLNRAATTIEEGNELNVKLKQVYIRLEEIDSDKAESKASAILNGLGFSPAQQNAATNTFSGGWRMRLALARALFCRPDLLLADEVTNYLDFPAVVWLGLLF